MPRVRISSTSSVGAVVVVAGDGGGVAVLDAAGLLDKGVPAGGPAAAGGEGAFDLEGGRGHPQLEIRAAGARRGPGLLRNPAQSCPHHPHGGPPKAMTGSPVPPSSAPRRAAAVRGAGTTRDGR